MSKDDDQFISMVSRSSILVDDRYSVCLPVRNKSLCMPNRSVAKQRVLNLQKGFSRDAKLHTDLTQDDHTDMLHLWMTSQLRGESSISVTTVSEIQSSKNCVSSLTAQQAFREHH